MMALVLSSCSHDIRVNDGWVIYDLRPLDGGCIMYYGEDERISIFNNRLIKFVGHQEDCLKPRLVRSSMLISMVLLTSSVNRKKNPLM